MKYNWSHELQNKGTMSALPTKKKKKMFYVNTYNLS